MASDNRSQRRRTVTKRLEDLQRAGVLQLPKVKQYIEAPAEVQLVQRPPQSGGSQAATAVAMEPPTNQIESPATALPSNMTEPKPTVAKKAGWQPARAESLFEAPAAANQQTAPALSLEVLQQQVAGCTRCNELASTRTQTVFGVGNPNSRLCFLGEAPGADEDKTGIPFVGRGGQLLTKIIEACRLKREDVYILNMLKCRPPGNRNPLPHELANCRGYLENQLDLIRPEFICCLGAVASQNLLNTTVSIGKLRGKLHSFRGAKVVCTYHPAFLLRSPSFKKETWEDMKLLMREMGVEL
jgi:uracil-DNA glycosylase